MDPILFNFYEGLVAQTAKHNDEDTARTIVLEFLESVDLAQFDESKGTLNAYLTRGCKWFVQNQHRRGKPSLSYSDQFDESAIADRTADPCDLLDARQQLEGFNATLSKKEQAVFDLHTEGYEVEEIAATTGATPGATKEMVRRIKLKARAWFSPDNAPNHSS